MSHQSGTYGTPVDTRLSSDSARFSRDVETAFNGVLGVLKVGRQNNADGAPNRQGDPQHIEIPAIEEIFDSDRRVGPPRELDSDYDRKPSIGELTSFLIAGLEDARRREGVVDARHIIAQLNEGLRRRAGLREDGYHGQRLDEMRALLHAMGDFRLADSGSRHFVSHPAENAGALVLPGLAAQAMLARPNAVESRFEPGFNKRASGFRLDLDKSAASVDFPERGGTIRFSNRRAVLTLPGFGRSYQFQLTSRRMTARGLEKQQSARLGMGAAFCALIVAGVLLYALPRLPNLPTLQPRSVASAEAEKASSKPNARPAQPLVSIMRVPLFEDKASVEKTPAAESQPIAIAAPGHVVTRSTTNLRARPEQGAQVVRVVPGRLILTVFAHNDDWVQVGGTDAWGWVPSNLISTFAPKTE